MATYYSSPTNERDQQANTSYPVQSVIGNLLYLNNPSSNNQYPEFTNPIQSERSSCIEDPRLVAASLGPHHFSTDNLMSTDLQAGVQIQFDILNGQSNLPVLQSQALSLSLNSQIPAPWFHYYPVKPDISLEGSRNSSLNKDKDYGTKLRDSKYLKAAQELLDEVVNVWRAIIKQRAQKNRNLNDPECKYSDTGDGKGSNSSGPDAAELSPSEKQELQNKLAKLLSMLDDVDRKYKHYYHQMQIMVSSFDIIAGPGSSKPYTAVALHTISRHFRCLRDAINDQVHVIRKKLGEEDSGTGGRGGGRLMRLRYIDQQLRQQRAFQQFGLMQQNSAWRPQRGLPENSVSVLRAWLFEHFLHPYPSDSEKLMLARQTGLTRGQISNWFINARVRLWKPMIEDMYKEEIGETELDSNSSSDNNGLVNRDNKVVVSSEEREERSHTTTQFTESKVTDEAGPGFSGATNICLPNEANAEDTFMSLLLKDQRASERYIGYGNQSVSLTLGLQHSENGNLSVPINSQVQPGFIEVNSGEDIYEDYETINAMNQQSRLHDFVA